MALEPIKNIETQADAGMFNLPAGFDTEVYAAEWAEEKSVPFKAQRQVLPQTGMTADGWVPWKLKPSDKPTFVTDGRGRKYFLLCRPKSIQRQVNALFGNVSKKVINREVKGETITTAKGDATQDPGMLSEKQLVQTEGSIGVEQETLPENEITEEPSAVIET